MNRRRYAMHPAVHAVAYVHERSAPVSKRKTVACLRSTSRSSLRLHRDHRPCRERTRRRRSAHHTHRPTMQTMKVRRAVENLVHEHLPFPVISSNLRPRLLLRQSHRRPPHQPLRNLLQHRRPWSLACAPFSLVPLVPPQLQPRCIHPGRSATEMGGRLYRRRARRERRANRTPMRASRMSRRLPQALSDPFCAPLSKKPT
jgi:hypothetical protein